MNLAAIAGAIKNRNVLVTLLGFTAFTLVLHGAWLILVVYAFAQGGAAETGTVAFAVLVPAAVLSPAVAVWFDRFVPRIALMLGFGAQAALLALVATSVAAGVSRFVVYALFGAFAIAQMSSRPTVSSVLPRVVLDPMELAAANSATGTVETIGLMAGPGLAGLMLYLFDDPAISFGVLATAMAAASALSLLVNTAHLDDLAPTERGDSVWAQVGQGVHTLRTEPATRHLVAVVASMRLTVGVLGVGVVILAIDHLGRSEATAGVLATAIGVGALVGSGLTFLLVGRRWLSLPIVGGLICSALPVALIAGTDNFWIVLVLLGLAGLGRPVAEVAGRTLLQGLSPDDMLARVFGILEGISYLVYAIGSAVFSTLAVAVSLEAALVITGLAPCVVALSLLTRLRRIDAQRPECDPALLSLIRSTPLFAPLAAFRIEQMLQNLHRQVWMPGTTIFEEGDYGEVLYVVDSGWVHIDIDDHLGLRRGGFFGEIAVLRRQPRMATVRVGSEGAVTYRIHRDVFLDALASAPNAERRSERIIEARLGESSETVADHRPTQD